MSLIGGNMALARRFNSLPYPNRRICAMRVSFVGFPPIYPLGRANARTAAGAGRCVRTPARSGVSVHARAHFATKRGAGTRAHVCPVLATGWMVGHLVGWAKGRNRRKRGLPACHAPGLGSYGKTGPADWAAGAGPKISTLHL